MSTTNEQDYLSLDSFVKTFLGYVSLYGSVLVHPFGLISNAFSIVIFSRKKFWENTMGYYNIILSIDNNIVIAVNFIMSFSSGYGNDILLWSSFNCAFLFFVSRVSVSFSSWLNVMVSLDRMLFIIFPNRFLLLRKKKILTMIISVIFILLFAINSPNFYLYVSKTYSYTNASNISTVTCGPPKNLEVLVDMIRILTRALIPFVLIIVINSFLIYKLIKTKSRFRHNVASKREYKFAYSISALSVFFIVSLTPFVLTLLLLTFMSQANLKNTKAYLVTTLCYGISVGLTTYNYCFVFLINLRFNSLFRDETVKFLKGCKKYFFKNQQEEQSFSKPQSSSKLVTLRKN